MTIRVLCDGCGKTIDRDVGGWFGVDYTPPPVEAEPDEDGTVYLAELVQLGMDHEFHLCSADCGITWLMNRSYDLTPQSPTEATT